MIGKRLRALREDAERWAGACPSVSDVAAHLGVTVGAVSRWERGGREVPSKLLPEWLDFLKATPGERAALLRSEAA